MPVRMPSKLLSGLPGAAQMPSKDSSVFCPLGSRTEGVGIHFASTAICSFAEACAIDFSIAGRLGAFGSKSPRIPMRTESATKLILIEVCSGAGEKVGAAKGRAREKSRHRGSAGILPAVLKLFCCGEGN